MRTFAIAMLMMIVISVFAHKHIEADKPLPEPVDFHGKFTYKGCWAGFADIFGQLSLLYGDLYGTAGLNTAFYRIYQFGFIRIPAWWNACF